MNKDQRFKVFGVLFAVVFSSVIGLWAYWQSGSAKEGALLGMGWCALLILFIEVAAHVSKEDE